MIHEPGPDPGLTHAVGMLLWGVGIMVGSLLLLCLIAYVLGPLLIRRRPEPPSDPESPTDDPSTTH